MLPLFTKLERFDERHLPDQNEARSHCNDTMAQISCFKRDIEVTYSNGFIHAPAPLMGLEWKQFE